MKYLDEFRNNKLVPRLKRQIHDYCDRIRRKISIMEVCGTHTVAIFRSGIRDILPKNINIISGPGCPVCVTDQTDIDRAVSLAQLDNTIITTFGDMIKVPGSQFSLAQMKAKGADVRVVYSALDALEIAKAEVRNVIHLGVGFETTAPTIAAVLKRAEHEKIKNFYILSMHKIVPPALDALVASAKSRIDAFILPGHVSAIIGVKPYQFIAERYRHPGVIAGFEPVDILQSIAMLCEQMIRKYPCIQIQYARCVHPQGNVLAQKILKDVFEIKDVCWRGLGVIKQSGLFLKKKYLKFDALQKFNLPVPKIKKTACRCGDVLQGIISPLECNLFQKKCTPDNPIGPCMVSTEGACAAYHRYARGFLRKKGV